METDLNVTQSALGVHMGRRPGGGGRGGAGDTAI